MDLAQLGVVSASEAGADMPLLNPFTGAATGATLRVLGYDAEEVVAAVRAADRDLQKQGKDIDIAKAMDARRLARVCAAVTGWDNFTWDGEEPEFSKARLTEIVAQPDYSWIADQVEEFGKSRANFTPASLKG